MGWSEESDMSKMLPLTNPENIKQRCAAVVEADGIEIRKCKECHQKYGYPTKNAWAQDRLGGDQGICPNCLGVYDDPNLRF